ncbi:hypothetical protein GCM10009858_41690 [Terrabacter carboxydivorans]|uniref:Uncharacterized protein n=1 Tax=Terrabacter carboxydivorans TaxID=619730 RepID=A0ABP5ZI95_9MICO
MTEDVHEERHGEGQAAGDEPGQQVGQQLAARSQWHEQADEDTDDYGNGETPTNGGHVRRLPPWGARWLGPGWGCAGGRLHAGCGYVTGQAELHGPLPSCPEP